MRARLDCVTVKRLMAVVAFSAIVLVTSTVKPRPLNRDVPATPVGTASSSGAVVPAPPVEVADASAPSSPSAPRIEERTSGVCPQDMILVDGAECAEVEQPCLEWVDEPPGEEQKMRCLRFASSRCTGALTHARFCIDRYEYPNVKGRLPVVMKTWTEATTLCGARGRRLCKSAEWTLACEGEARLPYPYGFVRDDTACNTDRPLAGPFPRFIKHRPRGVEISLVDWRAPSGQMQRCVSPFGVHDMTGNVDEWVTNESGHPYASGLKGGYWGPVRDRCRPMTTAHDERFAFYQIGFRCCEDPPRRSW